MPDPKVLGIFSIFLSQFLSPLIYILLAAAMVVFLMNETADAIIILFILLFNAVVGTIQEGKAQNKLLALRKLVETSASVLRDGRMFVVPDKEIVPGDVCNGSVAFGFHYSRRATHRYDACSGDWRVAHDSPQRTRKKLQAVEALGQAKIIVVDKTGTLTKNEMLLEKVYIDGKFFDVQGQGYEPRGDVLLDGKIIDPLNHTDFMLAGRVAAFCSNAHAMYLEENKTWKVSGDPTEAALEVFAKKSVSKIPARSPRKFLNCRLITSRNITLQFINTTYRSSTSIILQTVNF